MNFAYPNPILAFSWPPVFFCLFPGPNIFTCFCPNHFTCFCPNPFFARYYPLDTLLTPYTRFFSQPNLFSRLPTYSQDTPKFSPKFLYPQSFLETPFPFSRPPTFSPNFTTFSRDPNLFSKTPNLFTQFYPPTATFWILLQPIWACSTPSMIFNGIAL